MTKFIHLDYRRARTKEEKECWAISYPDTKTADVFINVDKNRKSKSLTDTFFHEMAHIFFAFHGKAKQMTDAQEEELCNKIGQICSEALK